MTKIISADEHLVEPPEFWSEWLPSRLPAAARDCAPKLEGGALVLDGYTMPVFRMFPDLVAYNDVQPGASDLAGRLAVMDRDGIDISILFPQRAMGMFGIKDAALRTRCLTAYNEYLSDFAAESGGKLVGVGILPTVYEPEATVDYLARLKDLGFRLFMIPGQLRGTSYAAPEMTPFWSAIEESGLITAFHVSETPDDSGPGGLGTYLLHTSQPFRKTWANLVFSGVLERHPGIRVLFAEGGISWIPSALADADRIHSAFASYLNPRLTRPPSEYWFRQCYATFMDDQSGLDQIDRIGIDHVLWSSDYPHLEGTQDHTRDVIGAIRDQMSVAASSAILGGNAISLLGLAA